MNIDKSSLKKMDLFIKDLHKQAFIIKYELITPDMFLAAFRKTEKDGKENYYAFLEYDSMYSIKHARKVITKHFAPVQEFVSPLEKQKGRTQLEQKSTGRNIDHGWQYLLARTSRPTGNGYWATNISIMPGDDIDEKLVGLGPKDKQKARKMIENTVRNYYSSEDSVSGSFLETWQKKAARKTLPSKSIKTNDTIIAMNIFKNTVGGWEIFNKYTNKSNNK